MGEMEEYSDPRKIFLDFDRCRTPRLRSLFALFRMLQLRVLWIRDDKTRKGWHRVIALRQALPRLATCAIQYDLGSDPRRERLNLMRLLRTQDSGLSPFQERRWNILYRTKLE